MGSPATPSNSLAEASEEEITFIDEVPHNRVLSRVPPNLQSGSSGDRPSVIIFSHQSKVNQDASSNEVRKTKKEEKQKRAFTLEAAQKKLEEQQDMAKLLQMKNEYYHRKLKDMKFKHKIDQELLKKTALEKEAENNELKNLLHETENRLSEKAKEFEESQGQLDVMKNTQAEGQRKMEEIKRSGEEKEKKLKDDLSAQGKELETVKNRDRKLRECLMNICQQFSLCEEISSDESNDSERLVTNLKNKLELMQEQLQIKTDQLQEATDKIVSLTNDSLLKLQGEGPSLPQLNPPNPSSSSSSSINHRKRGQNKDFRPLKRLRSRSHNYNLRKKKKMIPPTMIKKRTCRHKKGTCKIIRRGILRRPLRSKGKLVLQEKEIAKKPIPMESCSSSILNNVSLSVSADKSPLLDMPQFVNQQENGCQSPEPSPASIAVGNVVTEECQPTSSSAIDVGNAEDVADPEVEANVDGPQELFPAMETCSTAEISPPISLPSYRNFSLGMFQCAQCSAIFYYMSKLKAHYAKDHKDEGALKDVMSGCTHCGAMFITTSDFRKHQKITHGIIVGKKKSSANTAATDKNVGSATKRRLKVPLQVPTKGQLKEIYPGNGFPGKLKSQQPQTSKGKKPRPVTQSTTNSTSSLMTPLPSTSSNLRPLAAEDMSSSEPGSSTQLTPQEDLISRDDDEDGDILLQAHVTSEPNELKGQHGVNDSLAEWGCYCLCSKKFSNITALNRHVVYYSAERKLTCEDCRRVFLGPNQFCFHMNHKHNVNYKASNFCKRCDETFPTNLELVEHFQMVHNPDSPLEEMEFKYNPQSPISPSTNIQPNQ